MPNSVEVVFISRFFFPEQMELIIEKFSSMLFFSLDAIITIPVRPCCLFLVSETRTDYLIMIYVVTFGVNRFRSPWPSKFIAQFCSFHLLTIFYYHRSSAFSSFELQMFPPISFERKHNTFPFGWFFGAWINDFYQGVH